MCRSFLPSMQTSFYCSPADHVERLSNFFKLGFAESNPFMSILIICSSVLLGTISISPSRTFSLM